MHFWFKPEPILWFLSDRNSNRFRSRATLTYFYSIIQNLKPIQKFPLATTIAMTRRPPMRMPKPVRACPSIAVECASSARTPTYASSPRICAMATTIVVIGRTNNNCFAYECFQHFSTILKFSNKKMAHI